MKRPAMFGKVPAELLSPGRTREQIERHLDEVWGRGFAEMDWAGMEGTLVAVLNCESIDAFAKVGLSKDTVDAYTRRGHFPHTRASAQVTSALRKAFNEYDLNEDDRKVLERK